MVFIMDAKNEADIRAQLDVTAKIRQQVPNPDPSPVNLDLRLDNLEGKVTQTSEQMTRAISQLKIELLAAIDTKLPKPVPALEAFNRIDEPAIAHDAINKMAFLGIKKSQDIVQRLQEFKKKQQGKEFKSFAEVLEAIGKNTRGARILSEKRMLEAIDRWN